MFDGDPQARVKDRDRDRAVYVIDAALRNAQISQADRDLRVERVRAAATVGELEGLVSDLDGRPLPTPATAVVAPVGVVPAVSTGSTTGALPTTGSANPYVPGVPRSTAPVPADLYGPPPSAYPSTLKTTLSGTTKTKRSFRWVGILVVVFFAAPGLFGGIIAAFQSGGSGPSFPGGTDAPTPSGPPFVLDGAGLRGYVSAFRDNFGQTTVIRSVFYDGYVVSWVPDSSGKISISDYRDSAFDQMGDPMDPTDADGAPVDLADLKPAKVMKLVRVAQTTLDVAEPATTYVIYDRNVIDSKPEVSIYITNDNGDSGFLRGDLDGKVVWSQGAGG